MPTQSDHYRLIRGFGSVSSSEETGFDCAKMGVRVSILLRRYIYILVYMYRFSSDIADPSGSNNSSKKTNGFGGGGWEIEREKVCGGV